MISFYANHYDKTPSDTLAIDSFLDGIKTGRWKELTSEARGLGIGTNEYKAFKLTMPGVTIAGTFVAGGRIPGNLEKESGFICLDFDHLQDVVEAKRCLVNDPYVYGCFLSLSGQGLAVIVKKPTGVPHNDAFISAKHYFESVHNLFVDNAAKEINRCRAMSYDPECHINKNVLNIKKYTPPQPPKKSKAFNGFIVTNKAIERLVANIEENNTVIAGTYDEWLHVAFSLASLGEEGKAYYHRVFVIAVPKYKYSFTDKKLDEIIANKRNQISLGTFLFYAKLAGVDIDGSLPWWNNKVIYIASEEKKRKGTPEAALSIAQGNIDIKPNEVDELKAVIAQVFKQNVKPINPNALDVINSIKIMLDVEYPGLKWNEVLQCIEYQIPKKGIKTVEDRDLNTIACEFAINDDRLVNKKSLIQDVMQSRHIESYNPFMGFFRKYQNVQVNPHYPNIQAICDSIETDTGINDDGVDADYKIYFFKKWGVGMISHIYGQHSPLYLILCGVAKNIGKTEFFRRLLPEELKPYYSELQDGVDKKDLLLQLANNILILNDEFTGATRREIQHFKQLTSMQVIDVRTPYGRFSKKRTRLAALAGTCNDLDIISDPDVNRRIIPINVLSIDFDRYNSVDKVNLFLELHALFLAKFTHNLNKADIERLENATGSHKTIQIEKELLEKYFEPNDYLEDNYLMTCTDILHFLSEKTKVRINPATLFRHMSKMYRKKRIRGESGRKAVYFVEKKRGFDFSDDCGS